MSTAINSSAAASAAHLHGAAPAAHLPTADGMPVRDLFVGSVRDYQRCFQQRVAAWLPSAAASHGLRRWLLKAPVTLAGWAGCVVGCAVGAYRTIKFCVGHGAPTVAEANRPAMPDCREDVAQQPSSSQAPASASGPQVPQEATEAEPVDGTQHAVVLSRLREPFRSRGLVQRLDAGPADEHSDWEVVDRAAAEPHDDLVNVAHELLLMTPLDDAGDDLEEVRARLRHAVLQPSDAGEWLLTRATRGADRFVISRTVNAAIEAVTDDATLQLFFAAVKDAASYLRNEATIAPALRDGYLSQMMYALPQAALRTHGESNLRAIFADLAKAPHPVAATTRWWTQTCLAPAGLAVVEQATPGERSLADIMSVNLCAFVIAARYDMHLGLDAYGRDISYPYTALRRDLTHDADPALRTAVDDVLAAACAPDALDVLASLPRRSLPDTIKRPPSSFVRGTSN